MKIPGYPGFGGYVVVPTVHTTGYGAGDGTSDSSPLNHKPNKRPSEKTNQQSTTAQQHNSTENEQDTKRSGYTIILNHVRSINVSDNAIISSTVKEISIESIPRFFIPILANTHSTLDTHFSLRLHYDRSPRTW